MELDVYQQCPCHPDKKIKFCCGKEVIGDLNRVIELERSRQTQAALDSLDRALKKHGPQDCLLTAKVKLLLSLRQFEEANQVNEQFLSRSPQHYLGLVQRANIEAVRGNLVPAYEALQDAMDHLPGADIPISFAESFRNVAILFLQAGICRGAAMHALVAVELSDGKDETSIKLLRASFSFDTDQYETGCEIYIPELPEGELPWRKRYENVIRAFRRGQFRKGREIAQRAWESAPEELALIRLLAWAHLPQPDTKLATEHLARYARHPQLPLAEQINAEVLYQSYAIKQRNDIRSEAEYEISDFDTVVEWALSNALLSDLPGDFLRSSDESAPPPRHLFEYLSQPISGYEPNKPVSQYAVSDGLLAVYGRQTDMPPRVQIFGLGAPETHPLYLEMKQVDAGLTAIPERFRKIASDPAVAAIEKPIRVTPEVPAEQHKMLEQMRLDEFFGNKLIDHAWPILEGSTVRQLISQPQTQARAHAFLLICLLSLNSYSAFRRCAKILSDKLECQVPPQFGINDLADYLRSFLLISCIKLEELDEANLIKTFQIVLSGGSSCTIQPVLEELNRREISNDRISRAELLSILSELAEDYNTALDYLTQAKTHARGNQEQLARVMVTEFRLRAYHNMVDGLEKLFKEIVNRFGSDQAAMEHLQQTLWHHGYLTEDGRLELPVGRPEEADASRLWVPSAAAEPDAASEGSEQPSRLWLPGQ